MQVLRLNTGPAVFAGVNSDPPIVCGDNLCPIVLSDFLTAALDRAYDRMINGG